MNIHLYWEGNFNESLPLFNVEISQDEDCFAMAKIIVRGGSKLPPLGTLAVVKEGDEILFKGILESSPLTIQGYFAEIILLAKPINFIEKLEQLQKLNRVQPYWDALFVGEDKLTNLEERQDFKMTSVYVDRITGEITESHWFEGRTLLNIDGDFIKDSLQFKELRKPLKACSLQVHAHWVQSEWGIANLSSTVRRAFPHSKVNTYTKESLQKKWPETGKKLGRSGVWILKSELKQMNPPANLYPKYSPELQLKDEKGKVKPIRLRRYWFKPKLWVGWKIKQRRKETLSLTLNQESNGETKHLEYTLQDINPDPIVPTWYPEVRYRIGDKIFYKNAIYNCLITHTSSTDFENENWKLKKTFHTPLGNPSRATFFLTDRGYLAAEHAIERARFELEMSNRNIQVSFEGTWKKLKTITTDTTVVLHDPSLPGGMIKGKVFKYSLMCKGDTGERLCRITLLCSERKESTKHIPVKPRPSYVDEETCDLTYQAHEDHIAMTPSGLFYYRYDSQGPRDISNAPLIRGVELSHGPLEQEAEMRNHKLTSSLSKALSSKPTHLRIYFKDLRTRDCIDHKISCSVMSI